MAQGRRSNLLFLYTDEQRFDTLACYGNEVIPMPNLNRFAASATVFEKAYVTQPVCTPSRGSLLTGLYPHTHTCTRNNIPLPQDVPCLPEMLSGDYCCAHHGKWHLGDEIYAQHGFREWMGTEDTYHRYYSSEHDEYADRSSYHHWLKSRGVEPWQPRPDAGVDLEVVRDRFFRKQIHQLPEEHCRPTFLAESACHFLRGHMDTPFALYVNFLEPHMPFHSCRDGRICPEDVLLPADAMDMPDENAPLRLRLMAEKYRRHGYDDQSKLADEHDWRDLTARYWGMCSLVDTAVGRILDTLERTGLAENTIVVFTSDHGDMMSSHNMLGKGVMYEESARVPMLIRTPGQQEQRRVATPVSQVDVVPTLLDLMDQPRPGHLEGESLRPALEGDEKSCVRDVFIEWHNDTPPEKADVPDYAGEFAPAERCAESLTADVRTLVSPDGWKLNIWTSGEHELYDLNTDPRERTNRIGDGEKAGRVGDMFARIRERQESTGDSLELPVPAQRG
ncbi:MAG: sulfatase [Phycisphaerae bacterium]